MQVVQKLQELEADTQFIEVWKDIMHKYKLATVFSTIPETLDSRYI